jgi:hypothetical protein
VTAAAYALIAVVCVCVTFVVCKYIELYYKGVWEKREARLQEIESNIVQLHDKHDDLKNIVGTNAVALKRMQDQATSSALKGLKV